MARTSRPLFHRPVVRIALVLGAVLMAGALALFQPWKLLVDRTVSEAPRSPPPNPPHPVHRPRPLRRSPSCSPAVS
jgi:hypothetical protein